LREQNDVFQTTIHAFPPDSSLQSLNVADFTQEESRALWDSYRSEMLANNSIFNYYYLSHVVAQDDDGYSVIRGEQQSLNSIDFSGYVGTQRFNDYATIRMEAPKTVALLMSITNKYAKEDSVARFKEAVKRNLSALALADDSVTMSLEFYNVDMDEGEPFMTGINLYLSGYNNENDSYAPLYKDYAQRLADILQRAQPTDSPEGMFASFSWSMYDSTTFKSTDEPVTYLRFTAEDEATIKTMIDDWQYAMYYGY
jgi:hypothetical protein